MCNICYAEANKISAIDSNPSTLCQTHRVLWEQEKACGEVWN